MIICLPKISPPDGSTASAEDPFVAVQSVAHIQRLDRNLTRSVLEGMLRELVEHWIVNAWARASGTLEERRALVETGLLRDLEGRGVALKKLELRPLPRLSRQDPSIYQADWTEFLLDDIQTLDGFQLSLDLVVRTWVHPRLAERGVLGGTRSAPLDQCETDGLSEWRAVLRFELERELREVCQGKHLEDLLGNRQGWADLALRGLSEGPADAALDLAHSAVLGHGHGAALDALWVTDLNVKARHEAFRPSSKPRYADPFLHFFFQAYGDTIREALREEGDR